MSDLDNTLTPWEEVRTTANFNEHEEAAILARTLEMRAECLAELRKQRNHSQAELAELIGISAASISRRETSKDPRFSTIQDHVEALGGKLILAANFDGEIVAFNISN